MDGDTFQVIQIIDMQNYTVKTLCPGESIMLTPDHLTYSHYVYLNMRTRKKSPLNQQILIMKKVDFG